MYKRILDLKQTLKAKSVFLLGPRQTGKSTLLKTLFPKAKYVDLLEANTFRELSRFPESLRESLTLQDSLIIIDEIQKLPSLLDEVQLLIDRNKNLRFILTGSSARKLKRGHANLLGGRARFCKLNPLVSPELEFQRYEDRLNIGSLPAIIDSEGPQKDLMDYVGTYLKEEILAESITRSIENFSRFLEFASHLNAEQINYTKIGNDAEVSPRTIKDYLQVLEDTLVAKLLPAYKKTTKRKPSSTSKLYFFDLGVANILIKKGKISPGTPDFGKALEHLVFLELSAYLDYSFSLETLTYWRSLSQFEVDFLIEDHTAIEVKATSRVSSQDLKGLNALSEEIKLKHKIVVSGEKHLRVVNGIQIMPYPIFFKKLWNGEIFTK